MVHAREDYQRIQDPEDKIPADEPVFMVRAKDKAAAATVEAWANLHEAGGGDKEMADVARAHAQKMREWPEQKIADM